ncbi:MAG: hypothetical protein IPN71_21605 [Fibrobacteres bacterium]|nr:hypothetical protein [Fibrobacterota bacterium]
MDGYKLPIKGVTMDLGVKSGEMVPNLSVDDLDWTVGFETAPIGFALDLQLTRERIKTVIKGSYNKASDQTPVVVRLTTQGWPVYAKYADKHLDLSLTNWEIELTKDFPIEAMRNTAFHLDSLSVQTNGTSFDVKQFQASGTKSFPDGLAITSDVKLLGAPQNPVTVTLAGRKGQSPIFTLTAAKIKIGNKTYNIGCDGTSSISVSLDGDFEGDVCVQATDTIAVYPLNDPKPDVWIAGGENGTIPYELRLQIKDGEFGITLSKAHLRTKEIKPVFPAGVDAIISAGVFVKDGSLRLKQGSAFLKLGADNKGWVKVMKPFSVTVPDLRFFYNTTAQDAVVTVPDPNDSKKNHSYQFRRRSEFSQQDRLRTQTKN